MEGDLADLAEILFGDLDDEDAEMPEPGVDLDEAWHGVDCLLTGTAWDLGDGPAGEAILGGEEIGRGPGIQLRQPVRPEKCGRRSRRALGALSVETSTSTRQGASPSSVTPTSSSERPSGADRHRLA